MQFSISYRISRLFLYLLVAVFVLWKGVITEPDTLSYVGLSIITPPGYGTFLFVFRKLLGDENYFPFIVLTQLILCFTSCWYLIKILKRIFTINKKILILIDVILLAPVLIPEYLVVNRIVTQGLTYPFFLIIISFLLQTVFEKRKFSGWFLLISVFAGILTRTQFLFIVPVILLVLGYQWYLTRNLKKYVPLGIAFIAMPVLVSVIQKTFNYAVHDNYINISSTGLQVMIMPFFVADAEDYLLYKSPKTQAYYKQMYQTAVDRKLLDDFYKPVNDNVFHHFDYNFVNISYGVLSKKGRLFLRPSDPDSIEAMIENDKFLMDMWLPLLLDNFWKCLDLFYKNVEHAFGGFYMIWFYVLVFVFSGYSWRKYDDELALFSLLLMVLTFSNILLVCIVQHSIGRYMIYHQWFLPVLLILLFNRLLLLQKSKTNP
ncbi:glycosyltransferase family 39 protein [Aquimarina sp. RZ0]|uniref:glycosyltransferase family 39 protein n=1 Tax=Aquimarina sp. RZ0 TaxID=2607730 RepID=UPI0011F09C33|nr:glycosyltransferase family 39 protein [Aquimarina sp. RZ0]KAA1242625.1 glycosyltransferase family 39 protein [Aquimarina sp. RZ0]